MTGELRITRHDADSTPTLRRELTAVYAAAHRDLAHDPWFSPEQFWDRLVRLYAPGRDFATVAGWLDDAMIGYAFGSPRDETAEMWEAVRTALPDIPVPDRPEPVYIFREFAVRPEHQRHGHGRKLHDGLLAGRPERLTHLLVRPDNLPARSAYLAWGWRQIGTHQPFPDAPVMDALVRELPLRDMA